MKLRLRLWSSPYLSLATANSSPRLRRTLFATTKKPASLAGFRYLRLGNSHLTALFPLASPLSRSPRSLQLTIQTPSSF